MSGSDTDCEPCIVYEKINHPVITPKKAEAIKSAVRRQLFGILENDNSPISKKVLERIGGDAAVSKSSRANAQNKINNHESVWKKRTIQSCQRSGSVTSGVANVPKEESRRDKLAGLISRNPNVTKPCHKDGPIPSLKLPVQSVVGSVFVPGDHVQSSAAVTAIPKRAETVAKPSPVDAASGSHSVHLTGTKKVGSLNDRATSLVNSAKSKQQYFPSLSKECDVAKKLEESSSSSMPKATTSVISPSQAMNKEQCMVLPVLSSPTRSPGNSTCNTDAKHGKDDLLVDCIAKQASHPTNITLNVVPPVVKQDTITNPDADCSEEIQIINENNAQVAFTQVTPSKSNPSQCDSKKLSPQVKAHPWKFLNPSPGSGRRAASSGRFKRSPFKRSPFKRSARTKTRGSPVKARARNYSSSTGRQSNDGPGSVAAPAEWGSTTMDDIYCRHFKIMLLDVMNRFPFSEPELQIILNFINLSAPSKKLYIRMFSRKFCWHRVSEIVYATLGNDLAPVIDELHFRDFVDFDYGTEDLGTLLGLLKAPELRLLCQNLRVQDAATSKEERIQALLKYGSNQRTLLSGDHFNNVIKRELHKMLGECFKLCEAPRRLFQRILLMFALHQRRTGVVELLPQLIVMHEAEVEKIRYPSYHVLPVKLFDNCKQAESFHDADDLYNNVVDAVSRKDKQQVLLLTNEAEIRFVLVIADEEERARASSLPQFLRRFSACSRYAQALSIGAEALRKEKACCNKAMEILEMLLDQDLFLLHHRGFWYDKLALQWHFYRRDLKKAADVIIMAMCDEHVTEVQKYDLVCRGHRIHDAKNSRLSKQQKRDLYFSLNDCMDDPPSITISARVLPVQGPGRKRVYVEVDADTQETTYSSVEEYAISYYKKHGYSCGYHSEGSIATSLFALLFWDVLYELAVPAAFLGAYQEAPLDLNFPEFYASRKELVDEKLQQLEQMSVQEIERVVAERHAKHAGTISLVNWDLLPDVSRATLLVACLGPRVLARICERFAKSYRTARSGFPDLLVWSPSQKKCKIVEVKGPNDHLSGNQVLWLNYLIAAGADAEVCHVQTTGSKTAKRKSCEVEDVLQLVSA